MRKCKFYYYELQKDETGRRKRVKVEGEGKFQSWGLDYEEFEYGAASYSVGIIELDDMTIKLIPAEDITFLE